jgi:hypothetical protein
LPILVFSAPITADGKLHATSWVAPGTGILALDLNGNSKIDNVTEMFSQDYNGGVFQGTNWWGRASGYRYANGLAALASLSTSATAFRRRPRRSTPERASAVGARSASGRTQSRRRHRFR